jgi:hypothetical protein
MIQKNCDLVHSWRTVVHSNGQLFTGEFYPWAKSKEHSDIVMKDMYEAGVFNRGRTLFGGNFLMLGSPVMKDRIIPELYQKYGFNVDTSEWLAKTEIVRKIPLLTDIKVITGNIHGSNF